MFSKIIKLIWSKLNALERQYKYQLLLYGAGGGNPWKRNLAFILGTSNRLPFEQSKYQRIKQRP